MKGDERKEENIKCKGRKEHEKTIQGRIVKQMQCTERAGKDKQEKANEGINTI